MTEKEQMWSLLNNTLSNAAFLMINKQLIRVIGLKEAILLADLIGRRTYFSKNNKLIEEEWFFTTQSRIEADTTLSHDTQTRCLKTLKNLGIIETRIKGLPAKMQYRLCPNSIINALTEEKREQSHANCVSSNTQTAGNNNKNNIIKSNLNNTSKEVCGAVQARPRSRQESTPAPEKQREYSPRFKKIIEAWNAGPAAAGASRHDPARPTRLLDSAHTLWRSLLDGTYARECSLLTPDWADRYRIPRHVLDRKWSDDEILATIQAYALFFQPGYWPYTAAEKKKFLPRSLDQFLYAPFRECCSYFLRAHTHPPQKRGDQLPKIKDQFFYDGVRALVLRTWRCPDLELADEKKLVHTCNAVMDWKDDNWDLVGKYYQKFNGNYVRIIGTPDMIKSFTREVLDWYEDFYAGRAEAESTGDLDCSAVFIGMFSPRSTTFRRWQAHMRADHDLILNPTETEAGQIRARARVAVEAQALRERNREIEKQSQRERAARLA